MRRLLCTVLALAALAAQPGTAPAQQQTPFAPVAVVNGDAITGFDLEQRMRLLAALSGGRTDPAVLRNAAFDQLIEDRLKLQEGKRLGIEPTDQLLAEGLDRFAKQNGTTVEALRDRFSRAGVSDLAIRDSIGAEIVWLEVIRSRFLSRVDPGDAEVDAEIEQMAQGGSVSYRLQEIGLPAAGNPEAAEAEAKRLQQQLAQGGDFTAAVRRYSKAPSARRDGQLDWVAADRLPPEIAGTLAQLQPGEVAPPIRVAAGWSIIKMLERRQAPAPDPSQVDADTRERVRSKLVEQRIGRLADGLLQELRRDALIERR